MPFNDASSEHSVGQQGRIQISCGLLHSACASQPDKWLTINTQGDTEGFVRFDTADSAKTALAKADADGKVELVDGDAKRMAGIALITGDEEQALIDKVRAVKTAGLRWQSTCKQLASQRLVQKVCLQSSDG